MKDDRPYRADDELYTAVVTVSSIMKTFMF